MARFRRWDVAELKALVECYQGSSDEGPDWQRWTEIMVELEQHPGWKRKISVNTARRRCQLLLEGAELTRVAFQAKGPNGCLTFPDERAAMEACLVVRDSIPGWPPWPAVCDGSWRLPRPVPVPAGAQALTIQPVKPEPSGDDVALLLSEIARMKADQKSHEIRITRLERRKK